MVSLATPVYISVRALTDKVGPDISRGLSSSRRSVQRNGEDLGRAFSQGFNRGVDVNAFRRVANGLRSMVPEADQARKSFSSLIRTSYTLGTALTGIVGGASSVISSLGALAGAAGGAVSTVSVLGNAFFALGSGMAAVRLATGGIGGALQKLRQQTSNTAATAARSALQSVRDNQARELATRRIEDAERALARVVEDNRDRLVQANADIEDAQRALNAAIRDGREELQQVGFEAEDAALAESRAALELDRAREVLARAQDLPPNSRVRREAEIAFQEAELNYRKAADANADLQRESDRLARTGVNGLSSVIAARNDLADAEAEKAQVVREALQSEEDALRNVAEAREDANNVEDRQDASGAVAGVAAAGAAWDEGLNDAQRKFAEFINGLRPKFDDLKRIAAEAFLPDLQTAIETLMEHAYPVVARGIGVVSDAMGEAVINLANFMTTTANLDRLSALFDSSGRLIVMFGDILGRTYGIVLSILTATAPMAERFFGFLNTELGRFDDYLNTVEGNKALTDFFSRAEQTAVLFGDVFGNVFRGIGGIIDANLGEGTGGWILLEHLRDMSSGWGSSPELEAFFVNVANNATKVLDTLSSLMGILGRLGENQNIGRAFEILLQGAPELENILQTFANAAPSLAQLIVTITEIVSAMADTQAIQIFFDVLNSMFGAVLAFVSDPSNKEFLDFFGRIFAVFSAVGLAAGLVGTGLKIAIGSFAGLLSPIAAVIAMKDGLGKLFDRKMAAPLEAGLGALSNQFDSTGSHKDALIQNLGLFDKKMIGTTNASKPMVLAMENVGGTFRMAGADAMDTGKKVSLSQKIMAGFTPVLHAVSGALKAVGRGLLAIAMSPIFLVLAALVGLFVLLYNTNDQFKKDMDKVWADLSQTFIKAGQDILNSLMPLVDLFSDLMVEIAPLISMLITALVPVFTMLAEAIIPIVSILIQALVPVITTLVAALAPLITTLVMALVPVIQMLAEVLGFLIPIIAAVITVIVQVFAAVLTFIVEVLTAVITGVLDFIADFGSNWDNFWNGVATVITDVWNGIMAAIDAVWQWINTYIFKPIVDAVNWVAEGFELAGLFIATAWAIMMGALDAAWQWINTYIFKPIVDAVNWVGAGFEFAGKVIALAWEMMLDALDKAWQWIDSNIFEPIRKAVEFVGLAFETAGQMMSDAWQSMMDALNLVWLWIDDNIFDPIKTAVDLVQQAFENVADGIASAWEGIKRAAADPINFVIDTVYNKGLRSFWNDLAGTLGMNDLKLPRVDTIAFASGGVLPGYTPGRDVHQFFSPTAGRLLLSGGEAIMRPEWVRAVGGPKAVERMNRAARGGGNAGGTGGTNTRAYAGGGILDFGGDVLEFLGGIGAIVGDFFSNPKNAIEKHLIKGVLKPLLAGAGGGSLGELAGGIPLKIATSIGDSITKFFETSPPEGKPGQKMDYKTMFAIVKNQFPWATLNSGLRPGARTVNGGLSLHGAGRAIDVPPSMEIFNWIARSFPNSTELIYSPAEGRQLYNGRPYFWKGAVRDTHWDHVHWAMAKGGTVMPSPGGSIVNIAEAGQPERVEPLDPNGISERDKAWAKLFTQDMPRGDVNITVVARENEDTEALAQRVAQIVNDDIRSGSAH